MVVRLRLAMVTSYSGSTSEWLGAGGHGPPPPPLSLTHNENHSHSHTNPPEEPDMLTTRIVQTVLLVGMVWASTLTVRIVIEDIRDNWKESKKSSPLT